MIAVLKIGTSSVTSLDGSIDRVALSKLADEIAAVRKAGNEVVLVTSGAVTAGVATMWPGGARPSDPVTLQALSSIGQHRLMAVYDDAFATRDVTIGQVLLTPADFGERRSYLRARATLLRLLELDVVPIVNENDVLADDEIRFGDNDRLAALVANMLGAEVMVLLTDTAGLFDADPRFDESATLLEEVKAFDAEIERVAGGAGTPGGRGGMASKVAAARMASWSGVRTVIAAAARPHVVADAIGGLAGVGTVLTPSDRRLSARKLWIAFALPASGAVVIDDGARRAVVQNEASLLPAGVKAVSGSFDEDDVIEIHGTDGTVIAKGITRLRSDQSEQWMGQRLSDLSPGLANELVNRDDLVVLVTS